MLNISQKLIKPHPQVLIDFGGGQVHTNGAIELETTFRVSKFSWTLLVQYVLIDANTSYNILIGRTTVSILGAIISTSYLTMKFPNSEGNIFIVKVDQMEAQECYIKILLVTTYNLVSDKQVRIANINNVDDLNLIN